MAPSLPSRSLHTISRPRSTRSSAYNSPLEQSFASQEPQKRRKLLSGTYSAMVSEDDGEDHLSDTNSAHIATTRRGRTVRANPGYTSPVRPQREQRRFRGTIRPRFSSAAAAAAAVAQVDGFKPREEKGWEEFHQDLDLEALLPVFDANEVDGTPDITSRAESPSKVDNTNGVPNGTDLVQRDGDFSLNTPLKRKAGSSFRNPALMRAAGELSPNTPLTTPLPAINPKERLTLPVPAYKPVDPYTAFASREEFVDQSMAHVGYHEWELWARPTAYIRVTEGNIEDDLVRNSKISDRDDGTGIGPVSVGRVEYDMDEQDMLWLQILNRQRLEDQLPEVRSWVFEVMMTKLEKEWHALERRIPKPNPKPPQTHRPRSSSAAAVNGELGSAGEEQDSKCAICDDGDCENTNAIVFCDGCDLAVHQECYGVPFIPEGQWLCRKCQILGKGTPACIFCPNTDGAFKQTTASRWSHLLCAIWIPEVSIGNTTFMEPVMEVEKVPKSRWKLNCYICKQKMGACIQCANKNCYVAFHVSCARRARLFLQMKSNHGGPAAHDPSLLKAYCDKHVPSDWRRDYDTDRTIVETMDYYRQSMQGRLWADSQQAALTVGQPIPNEPAREAPAVCDEHGNPKITLKLGTRNASAPQAPKVTWKLASGAPVIPQALYQSIESSLQRFGVRKRKEFAAEICKYWTLKRESRRNAALLKRLQLQLETFTSMEIPRRNFAGMGAAGAVRLQRRIGFADLLQADLGRLQQLCEHLVAREREKLEDCVLLQTLVETIHFPIAPLLPPIIKKAQSLDNKGAFTSGLQKLVKKVEDRAYLYALDLGRDLAGVVQDTLIKDQIHGQIDPTTILADCAAVAKKDGHAMNSVKSQAKRIVKATQGMLEEAIRKQCQLSKCSPDNELAVLDELLRECLFVQDKVTKTSLGEIEGLNGKPESDTSNGAVEDTNVLTSIHVDGETDMQTPKHISGTALENDATTRLIVGESAPTVPTLQLPADQSHHQGGIPWYLKSFDPQGTTIHEESWNGRSLVREMSEDLSDMDEDEMSGLVDHEEKVADVAPELELETGHHEKKKKKKKSRRFY